LFKPLCYQFGDLIRVTIHHHHHVAVPLNPECRQINSIGVRTSSGEGGLIALRRLDEILPGRGILQVIAEHEKMRNFV